jgi:hypothetical protein
LFCLLFCSKQNICTESRTPKHFPPFSMVSSIYRFPHEETFYEMISSSVFSMENISNSCPEYFSLEYGVPRETANSLSSSPRIKNICNFFFTLPTYICHVLRRKYKPIFKSEISLICFRFYAWKGREFMGLCSWENVNTGATHFRKSNKKLNFLKVVLLFVLFSKFRIMKGFLVKSYVNIQE